MAAGVGPHGLIMVTWPVEHDAPDEAASIDTAEGKVEGSVSDTN